MIAAVAIALVASGVFSDDAPTAASTTRVTTTTTAGPTTTAVPTTAATSTTAIETTTAPTLPSPLLYDSFNGSTAAFAVYSPEFMTLEVIDVGILTAAQGGFVLPAMYLASVGDAVIDVRFRTDLINPGARGGVVVWSDDPSDGAVSYYTLVEVSEEALSVMVTTFDGVILSTQAVNPIPPEAAFDPTWYNQMTVILSGGTITVNINGVTSLVWGGPAPMSNGFVGFHVISGGPGDTLVVEDYTVTVP